MNRRAKPVEQRDNAVSPATARRGLTVRLRRVHLRRGERTVLRDVDWLLQPGQHWVVYGANGAGKTQLLKLLSADVWPVPLAGSARDYWLDGRWQADAVSIKPFVAYIGSERQDRHAHYAWNHRVLTVVCTGLDRSDIPLRRYTPLESRRALALLRRLRLESLAQRRFLTLSYGQRRLVLLARALAARPKLLLMDEVLNGLDDANRRQVLHIVHGLRRTRLTWVAAVHRPEDAPGSATHFARLQRGRLQWLARPAGLRRPPLRATRSAAAAAAGRRVAERARERSAAGTAPWAVLRNAWVWLGGAPVLRALDFSIESGQCWVVHGANGSGKSTLLRAIYGDFGVAARGELRRRGISSGVPLESFKQRVAYIAPELQTEHPLGMRADEAVMSGCFASIGLDRPASARLRARARAALRRVGAQRLADKRLRELSYGQVRRLLFARALVGTPELLLLDEPYTGLDLVQRARLKAVVQALLDDGRTVVLVAHRRDEWPRAVTHELELDRGRAVYCGPARL